MKLQFKKGTDLIFIDKPSGISTHAPDIGLKGICEIYEEELNQKLYVVHRLDKTTSGALVLATTSKRAAELTELFKEKKIVKKYWLLTDKTSEQSEFEVYSRIEAKGKIWESQACSKSEANSHTRFQRIKRSPFFELWEATPSTGKSHQIRLHAAQSGLPILGDETYGGTAFPHLCLHSQELHIPGEEPWIVSAPRFFERLGILKDSTLVEWISEIDRRQRLYGFLSHKQESLRLIHLESLRMDLFGPQMWFYWYDPKEPTAEDLERVDFISRLLGHPYLLKKMQNRGVNPGEKFQWLHPEWQSYWTAQEDGKIFQLSSERGQSPGLFLDQRSNRSLLQLRSKQKSVLNLFAYTCGFSVAAALGGATQVTSVDVSKTFLDWGRENFNLNQIDSSKYEFFTQDALLFLKGSRKRDRQFDFVICDPPSFGRHKDQVFKLDRDLKELLLTTWDCLTVGGQILFSCNLEKWDVVETRKQIQKILPAAKIQAAVPGWDYELPNSESLLKAFWIEKPKKGTG